MSGPGRHLYEVGGSLRPDARSYIQRAADTELFEHLCDGDFCYVLTSRQMGKSSLMARTKARLDERGIRTVVIDLTSIGTREVTADADRWYYGVAYSIVSQLGRTAELRPWWAEHMSMPAVQRFTEFIRALVIDATDAPIVVFIDEIDSTIALPFSDDFFAAVRACFNARATDPAFSHLTFALLGTASPAELVDDATRTPFNIGHAVTLDDFGHEEAAPLAAGLAADAARAAALLDRVLHWTGGQPFLTQKVCALVAEQEGEDGGGEPRALVDAVVRAAFLERNASEKETNLSYVRKRLTDEPVRRVAMLRLYRKVLSGKRVKDVPVDPVYAGLRLAGVVKTDANAMLIARNRIYATVFDKRWVASQLPVQWQSPVIAVLLLVVLGGVGTWYTMLLPGPYVELLALATPAERGLARRAFDELRAYPGYAARARSLWANYWDRWVADASNEQRRDEAILAALKAVEAEDTPARRRVAAGLLEGGHEALEMTVRTGAELDWATLHPDGEHLVTVAADGGVQVWNARTAAPIGTTRYFVSVPQRHSVDVEVGVSGTVSEISFALRVAGFREKVQRLVIRAPDGRRTTAPLRNDMQQDDGWLRVSAALAPDLRGLRGAPARGTWRLTLENRAPLVRARITEYRIVGRISEGAALSVSGPTDARRPIQRQQRPSSALGNAVSQTVDDDVAGVQDGSQAVSAETARLALSSVISRDGRYVANLADDLLRISALASGRVVLERRVPTTSHRDLMATFSPGGDVLALYGGRPEQITRSTEFIRIPGGSTIGAVETGGDVEGIALSGDGSRALIAHSETVVLVDVGSGETLATARLDDDKFLDRRPRYMAVSLSHGGRYAAAGAHLFELRGDSLPRLERVRTVDGYEVSGAVVLSMRHDRALVELKERDGTVPIAVLSADAPATELRVIDYPTTATLDLDGGVVLRNDVGFATWISMTGPPPRMRSFRASGNDDESFHLAASADGERLVTAGRDGVVRIWNSGALARIVGRTAAPSVMLPEIFSGDGPKFFGKRGELLVGQDNDALVFVDTTKGEVRARIAGIAALAVSPDLRFTLVHERSEAEARLLLYEIGSPHPLWSSTIDDSELPFKPLAAALVEVEQFVVAFYTGQPQPMMKVLHVPWRDPGFAAIRMLDVGPAAIIDARLSADGRHLVTVQEAGTGTITRFQVKAWSLDREADVAPTRWNPSQQPEVKLIGPRHMLLHLGDVSQLTALDSGGIVADLPVQLSAGLFDPRGRALALFSQDTLQLWDTESGRRTLDLTFDGELFLADGDLPMGFDASGGHLAVPAIAWVYCVSRSTRTGDWLVRSRPIRALGVGIGACDGRTQRVLELEPSGLMRFTEVDLAYDDSAPLAGDVSSLLDEWQRRLGLGVDQLGKLDAVESAVNRARR